MHNKRYKEQKNQSWRIIGLLFILLSVFYYVYKFEKINSYIIGYFSSEKAWIQIKSLTLNRDTTLVVNSDIDLRDTSNLISVLVNNIESSSQRLVLGLDDEYSLRYLLYRVIPVQFRNNKDGHINIDRITRINECFKYGIGGVHIKPNVLIQFNTFSDLNNFLDSVKNRLTRSLIIRTKYKKYALTIEPNFFVDWSFEEEGLNYNILSRYKDFDKNKGAANIIRVHIDGVFGPNLDYSPNIIQNYSEYKKLINLMYRNKQFCFFKHFCYRSEYRISKKSKDIDLHFNDVEVTTPKSKLYNEDLRLYDTFLLKDNKSGIMLGHHKLLALDTFNIVSTSGLIFSFISERYPGNITISDDLNMKAYSDLYENDNYYDKLSTNYILFSKLNDFKYIQPKDLKSNMTELLFLHKIKLGKILIKTL